MADDQNNLQQHLNSSIYGPPQTNPDERRQFLGSLRERCALRLTNHEIAQPETLAAFKKAFEPLKTHHDYKMLLNGKLDQNLTAPYMGLAANSNFGFTLVNDDTASLADTATALLIVAPDAINQQEISLPKAKSKAKSEKPAKKSLFSKLFK